MKKYKVFSLVGIIVFIIIGGFVIWGYTPPKPMDEAINALISDEDVSVENSNWISFQPQDISPTFGFILYPGGRVDPRSYAPLAKDIALAGYLVIIPKMPLNLAVLNPNVASKILESYPTIVKWAIGGHSLGGVMAANYVSKNLDQISILVLFASYPAADMSALNVSVLSISASEDGLSDPATIEEKKGLLPATTIYYEIQGGNHAQFGYYGDQSGDNPATISRAEQQSQILNVTLSFLNPF